MNCLLLGSGTWATALASVMARAGNSVNMWCRRPERRDEIREGRHGFLPGFEFPPGVSAFCDDEADMARGAEFVVVAIPTQNIQETLQARNWLPSDVAWVSTSKGVEIGSGRLPSQIIQDVVDPREIAVLSGPSHAEEVVRNVPTAVVLGCRQDGDGGTLQHWLSGPAFRVYRNEDPVGVEWGGALKNVIAIAAGIASGCEFGDNTLAALVTRGAVEMSRLGVAHGADRVTFSGLSGIGDLIVTCFSQHSRNRTFGHRVGSGEPPQEVLSSMDMVVEGVHTSKAVARMGQELGVELPIAEEVNAIVFGGKGIQEGVESLLSRSLTSE